MINRVKTRANFKAVFSDRNPIIIVIPDRFTLSGQGLKTGQSTLDGMNLAKGANCHGVLTNYQTFNKEGPNESTNKPGITGKNRGFIIQLYNAKNEQELEQLSKKNPFTIDGNDATILVNAIREAREYKNFVLEFNEKLPGNNYI